MARQWREILFPSGKTRRWSKPPRFVFWRHERAALAFSARMNEVEGDSPEEKGQVFIEGLSDEEGERFQRFLDDVVAHSLDFEQGESVDTLPQGDYMYAFALSTHDAPETIIKTTGGETDAETVSTFPAEPSVSLPVENVPDIRAESGGAHGNL